ncbi:MAG: lyase family protein [Pseudomonadota bacterium]
MQLLTAAIYRHAASAGALSDACLVAAMIRVEASLARAQEAHGLVPEGTAPAIETATVTGDTLAGGVASAGVPVPAFLAELRPRIGKAADHVHYGATSQDILDTALCLCFGAALDGIAQQLADLIDALAAKAEAHPALPMLGRTRGQYATPISFALRVANWAAPLVEAERALPQIRQRALKVQLGGSAGSSYAMHPHGPAIATAMAKELGLTDAVPWHADRSGFNDLAAWLTRVVTALAKMAKDLGLAARSEIGEMRAGQGGGSSTMPHKSNPVTTEALLACQPVALAAQTGLAAAAAHGEERDGAGWAVEWLLLPQLIEVTAAALSHAQTLAETLEPRPDIMAKALEDTPAAMAEALVFVLAPRLGRAEATARVKDALAGGPSIDADLPTATALAQIADEAAARIFATR